MVTGNEDFYFGFLKLANTFAGNWSEYKKKKTLRMFFEYKAEGEADFPSLRVEL